MYFMKVVATLCCALAVIHHAESTGSHQSGSKSLNQFPPDGSPGKMVYIQRPWRTEESGDDPSGGVSAKCMKLLEVFSNATGDYLQCIMTNARPLHYCEYCITEFTSVINAYNDIRADDENGTICRNQLLRADNVQVVLLAYNFVEGIWDKSSCHNCYNATVENGTTVYSPTEEALKMLKAISDVQSCFNDFGHNPEGNISVCDLCAGLYVTANAYYSKLEEESKLCSDLEDSMNYTRRVWSKNFKCDVGVRTNSVIYGIAAAIGSLPILFYVGAYVGTKGILKKRRSRSRYVTTEEREPINDLLGTSGT